MSEERLPVGWVRTTVGDLLTEPLSNGLSVKGSEQPPGLPALRLSAMGGGGFDYDQVRYLPLTDAEADGLFIEADDFFVSRGNGSKHLVGRGTLAQAPPFKVIYPDTMIRLRLLAPLRQSRWVSSIWSCPQVRMQLEQKAKTTAGIWKLSQPDIASVTLTLPPVKEQYRIVAAIEQHLSDIDAGVLALQRTLAHLTRYRAAVLKAAYEGRLVPTEAALAKKEERDYEPASVLLERILRERRARWEADQLARMAAKGQTPKDEKWKAKYQEPARPETAGLQALPEGWAWATVDVVGDLLLGRRRAPEYTGPLRSYLRVANIKDDRIDYSDVLTMPFEDVEFERYRLEAGDILLSEGQSPELVGRSAIFDGELSEVGFQATLHRFRAVPSGPGSRFAQMVFRAYVYLGTFRPYASITTNIAHLTLEKLRIVPFPLPPLAEQHRIVAEVDRLLSVADETEQTIRAQLARAARLRQSVLKRAFEGKLVPQDPADESATALLERIRAQKAAEPKTPKPAARARRS